MQVIGPSQVTVSIRVMSITKAIYQLFLQCYVMKLVESWVANGQVLRGSILKCCFLFIFVMRRGSYVLVRMYIGRRPGWQCDFGHRAMTYCKIPRLEVFVLPYPLGTKQPVTVQRSTLCFCPDTQLPSDTWPIGQSGSVSKSSVLMMYSPCVLVVLVDIPETVDALSIGRYRIVSP